MRMHTRIVIAIALIVAFFAFWTWMAPAQSHEWFTDKHVQTANEWLTQMRPEYSPPPPLRSGEEWLKGKGMTLPQVNKNPDYDHWGETGSGCCDGSDCWEIEHDEWGGPENGSYWVRRDGQIYTIPQSHAQPSESKKGRAAACIMNGYLRCFFIPLAY